MHYVSAQRGVVYRCGRFVLIAVGYLLFAQLGLLLATDHTQVSVVWPAAGLALAAVLLVGRSAVPAVVLGSLLANSLGPWGSAQDVLSASLTFLPVAVGAGLQAWLGAVLVRRGVAFPNPLYRTRDIWLFSLLSGPLACISNALISSLSFLLQGMIEPAEFFHHALIWWASDTMGVLIFAPACLLLVDSGTYLRRQRRWTVIVPVLLILSLLTSLTVRQQRLDANESVSALAQELETVRAFVDRDITVAYSLLDALKAFYRVAGNVTQSEFQSYTEHILSRHAWLFGMRWIERVTADARADWEASTGSVISTYDPHQQRRVAVPADVPQLYPVRFWVDSSGDRDLLGYTLGARAASLAERAGDDIVVLPSFRLQALPDTPLATIFASAVYAADSGELQGFVAVLLQFDQLLNNALQVGGQENLIVTLEDVTDPESPQPLFSSLPAQSGSGPGRAAAVPVEANTRYALLRAGGREWRLGVSPTPAYLDQLQGDSNALALVGALAFIWLLMLILLIVTGQEALVRGEVVEKTRQLRMALAAMQSASEAKSRFLASVSHELRTPLNSIIGF
ncbi:MAG TPA: MASE1 domain-containing protein, partial [Spongiibacteraceae bacterium]|nr:MASE1 domain-containing protein [Spongiibacteraceae bacterium]